MNPTSPMQSNLVASGRVRCPSTALAVPECSCTDCLKALMQTHAPDVVRGEAQLAS